MATLRISGRRGCMEARKLAHERPFGKVYPPVNSAATVTKSPVRLKSRPLNASRGPL